MKVHQPIAATAHQNHCGNAPQQEHRHGVLLWLLPLLRTREMGTGFIKFRLKPNIAASVGKFMRTLRNEAGGDRRAVAHLAARYFAVLKQSLEGDTDRFIARVVTHGRKSVGVSGLQAGHAASSYRPADG
jgi:hypothetical protein